MTGPSAILDLASRFDGYMVPFDATISDMLRDGLITMAYACEGFVIVWAIPKPVTVARSPYGSRSARGTAVRRYLEVRRPIDRRSEQLNTCQRPEGEQR